VAGIRKLHVVVAGVIFLSSPGFQSSAPAQAVAYEPSIGAIPSGATMTVVPAVSADRRYVRLSVNAFFNELNSLQTFSFPGGAVGGGGFAGLGGGVAGFGGMNGVIGVGEASGGAGVAMNSGMPGASTGGYAAGPLPLDAEFAEFFPEFVGDPLLDANAPAGPGLGRDAGHDAGGAPVAQPARARVRPGQGARATNQPVERQRPKAARKSSRRPAAKSRRAGH
jgi:hypothetical protein